LKQGD
jgi:NADH dehydrogenase (ubiquinone) Fe-S protein 1